MQAVAWAYLVLCLEGGATPRPRQVRPQTMATKMATVGYCQAYLAVYHVTKSRDMMTHLGACAGVLPSALVADLLFVNASETCDRVALVDHARWTLPDRLWHLLREQQSRQHGKARLCRRCGNVREMDWVVQS